MKPLFLTIAVNLRSQRPNLEHGSAYDAERKLQYIADVRAINEAFMTEFTPFEYNPTDFLTACGVQA